MNEELLQKLYDKYGFSAKGPFEQFRSDMNDPSVRRRVYDKYLSQKGSFDQFESDLGVGQSVQEDVQPEPEKEDKGVFYNTLGKIPLVGGALQSAYDAAERGLQKGATVEEGINAMFGGLSEDEATSVAAILKQNLKQVKGDNSITKKFTDEEGWNLGSMAGAWAEGIVESMAMMGRGLWDAFTDAKTAALVGSATAAGAAAGAPIAGVGALVGATSAALGTSSGLLEASQILYQEVQKELNERGLPITKQNIKNIFSDENWLEATRKKAAIKGGVVGAFDLLSGVVGGKFGVNVADLIKKKGLAKATMGDYLKAVGKASVIDPFFGAAGEYVSGQAIGEPASAKELFLEANPFGPGSITAPLSLYKDISKIRDAKDSRTQADKNNTPITKAEDSATKSSLNVGSLIDAVTSNDEDLQQKTFADLAARHTQQEFDEMIRSQGKIEGLEDNILQALSEEFSAYKAKEVKFENNGLTTDQKSRATELRAEVEKLEKQLESIGVLKNESDESLKARHEQTEEMIKAKIEEMKAAIAAVANRAETPIEDSPEWYKNKYEELSTVYSGEETSLSEKEKELLSIGRQLSQDIEEGSAEKIDLYQSGRGYFGSMDEVLFEDDGDSNPVLARKNLRGVMNALQKSIPATVHARIGKGDITAGRNLIKRAKELSLEIEGLHAKLNPGERLRRKNELNEIKSRYEALTETVPNEEYQLFINKGVVTPERLNSIAEKVKENPDKPKLSKNEKAIFDAKVSEINDILREKFSVDQKTKSDAVQEQKTDEVLLRNKQVGLQEMGEGNALAEEVQKTPDQKEEVVSNTASVATKGYNPSIQLKVHKETGGSTFTLDGENKAGTKSASVSIFPERSKIFDGEITEQDIADFKETNSDLYNGNEDVLALGTWFNKETGKTTLDVSSVLPKKEAVALGQEYNQISVFDLETFEEIPIGGTGEVISGLKSEIDRVSDIRKIQKESSKTSKPETTTKEEPVKSKAKPEPVVEKKPEVLQVQAGDVLIKYDKDGNKSEEITVTKVYQKDKNGYWVDDKGKRPSAKVATGLTKKSTQEGVNTFMYYKSTKTENKEEIGPTSLNMFNTDKSAGKVFYSKQGDIKFQEDVDENVSARTAGFFSDVVKGISEKYRPIKEWLPVLNFTGAQQAFKNIYDKFIGQFDLHIATSIPTFRETQIKVGNAIVEMFSGKDALIYDIAGSEGGFVKAVTEASNGSIKSINLDSNPDMKNAHEKTPVEGSTFVQEAFYQKFEDEHGVHPKHVPANKADVVHESMGFQFISKNREGFVNEIKKNYLKKDGLFVTEEKFSTDPETYKENEAKKNEYKDEYYTKEQQAMKADNVLVGMEKNQANIESYETLLKKKFKHVKQYWDSGNFKGFVASDSKEVVDSFMAKVGSTQSEFTTRNLENNILFQEDEPLESYQSEQVEDAAKVTNINPKNILDLIRVGRKLFNLPFQQALANAVVTDKLYGRMAKLENVTKSDIYKSIEYRKSTIEELTGKELQEVDKIRRGAMQSLEDGRAIIYALTDPNVSTPMHELAHVFEHYLTDEEKTTILKEAGHDSWTRETSEFFARGFEKYLAEGVSPTPKLQKYFEMFKKWLTEIYKGIKNSAIDIPLSVEMDNIYANMLDDEDFIVPPKSGIELNKATMNYIRDKVIDVDPLSPDHVSVDDQIKDAMENHITPENDDHPHHKEITLAYQAIIGKLLNASEQIAVGYAIRKLSDLRSQKEQELKLLKKGLLSQFKSDVTDTERSIAIIEGDIEILTRGLIRAGTTAGRALAIRKELLEFSKDNYEVMKARLIDHMPKDYKINKADETYLKELSERIKKLKEEIEASDVTHKKNSQAKQETIADISAKRLSQKGKERKEGRRSRSLKEATANLDKLLKGNNC